MKTKKIINKILQAIHEAYPVGAAETACAKVDPIADHVSKFRFSIIPVHGGVDLNNPVWTKVGEQVSRTQRILYNKNNLYPNKD